MPGDELQHHRGVEGADEDHSASLEQGRQARHVQTRGVEQRGHHEGHLVVAQVDVDQHVDAVPRDVAVGQGGALGSARGAGGVHDHAHVIEPDRLVDGVLAARLDQLLVAQGGAVRPGERDDVARCPPVLQLGGRTARLGSVDQDRGAAVRQHVGQLAHRQPQVERYEHRPQHARGEERLEKCGVIGSQVCDPVPLSHAELSQRGRQSQHPPVQLAVGELPPLVDDGDALGALPSSTSRPRADPLVSHFMLLIVSGRRFGTLFSAPPPCLDVQSRSNYPRSVSGRKAPRASLSPRSVSTSCGTGSRSGRARSECS